MSFRVLAIDPGNDTGWSRWEDGRLVGAGLGAPSWPGGPLDLVLVEVPQVYPGGPKVDPADLIVLAMNVGRHIERVRTLHPGGAPPCLGVWPRNWKGAISKDMHHRRVKTLIGPLNLAFADTCLKGVAPGKAHNVWDGIALGHWAIVQCMTGAKLGKSPYQTIRDLSDYVFRDL